MPDIPIAPRPMRLTAGPVLPRRVLVEIFDVVMGQA
jgi:hypothetical protein